MLHAIVYFFFLVLELSYRHNFIIWYPHFVKLFVIIVFHPNRHMRPDNKDYMLSIISQQ